MTHRPRTPEAVKKCIYCGIDDVQLTDEHVVPYGLSGDLVLPRSSCKDCATVTGKLERKLLRGHWWPYRQFLGLKSRRSKKPLPDLEVTIEHGNGEKTLASLPLAKNCYAFVFKLAPPAVLHGEVNVDTPYATEAFIRLLSNPPSVVRVEGRQYKLLSQDKINIPVNFDASDLCRFLAKVAHSYAIYRRGISVCREYFLPKYILGEEAGVMTYVGGSSSAVLGDWLPGSGTHALMDRRQGDLLSVYVQLFRHAGDPPPIYEIVVGRLA